MRSLLIACALLLGACVVHPPPTIVVADKDTRLRLESEPFTYREYPGTGRLREIRRDVRYREFWVKATDGTWYRINRRDWDAALLGQKLEIHPALPEPVIGPFAPCPWPSTFWHC